MIHEMLAELKRLCKIYIGVAKNAFRWRKNLHSNEFSYIDTMKTESNLIRSLFYVLTIFLVQISNLIVDRVTNAHPDFSTAYVAANLFLMVISVGYFFAFLYTLTSHKQEDSLPIKKALYRTFWFVFSAGMLFLCVLDLIERDSLVNYVVLLVSISILPILSKKEAFALFSFNLTVHTIAILLLEKKVFLLQQSTMIAISCAIVSQLLFYSYVSSNIAKKRLKVYAETDPLTGLPNRRGLETWLTINREDCVKQHCRIAIGMIDIDDFKEYNDKFGHLEGDQCLKYVANCIRESFVKNVGIVSRFGGEEFIVILKSISEKDAINKFVKIKSTIERGKNRSTNNKNWNVTISIGVVYEQVGYDTNFNHILRKADNALYEAKRNGKNIVVQDNGKCYH